MFDINKCKETINDMIEGVVPDMDKDNEETVIKKLVEKLIIKTNTKGPRYKSIYNILEGMVAGYHINGFEEIKEGYEVNGVKNFEQLKRFLPPGSAVKKIKEGYEISCKIQEDIDSYLDQEEGTEESNQKRQEYLELEREIEEQYQDWLDTASSEGLTTSYTSFMQSLVGYDQKKVSFVDFIRVVTKEGLYEYFDGIYSIGYPYLVELLKEIGSDECFELIDIAEKSKQLYDEAQAEMEKQGKETIQSEDVLLLYEEDFDKLEKEYIQYSQLIKQQVIDFLFAMKGKR